MPDIPRTSVESLLEDQKKLLDTVIEQNKKIQHRLTMMTVGGYLRLAIVVLPLIIGVLYLPILMKQITSQIGPSLGLPAGVGQASGGGGLPLDSKQLQELLKSFQQ